VIKKQLRENAFRDHLEKAGRLKRKERTLRKRVSMNRETGNVKFSRVD